MNKIERMAGLISSDAIEVVDESRGNRIAISLMLDDKKIGYMMGQILSVSHLDEIFSESIEPDEDDDTGESEGGYDHDLMSEFEWTDNVCELGMFQLLPEFRHRHLAKPCFLKGLEWIEKNRGGFKAFVGRALSQDMADGLEQSNLIGFYESVGFDAIADYGDLNGAIIVRRV